MAVRDSDTSRHHQLTLLRIIAWQIFQSGGTYVAYVWLGTVVSIEARSDLFLFGLYYLGARWIANMSNGLILFVGALVQAMRDTPEMMPILANKGPHKFQEVMQERGKRAATERQKVPQPFSISFFAPVPGFVLCILWHLETPVLMISVVGACGLVYLIRETYLYAKRLFA